VARGIRSLGRSRRRVGHTKEGASLGELIAELPEELRRRAVTHSSWAPHRADSYGRLAFLGDGVLGLAVGEHLFRRFPRADIGRLTKVHGQAVSGRACAEVARELGLPAMLTEVAPASPEGGIDADSLLASERAMASMCEAVIGACYLHHGFQPRQHRLRLARHSGTPSFSSGTLRAVPRYMEYYRETLAVWALRRSEWRACAWPS